MTGCVRLLSSDYITFTTKGGSVVTIPNPDKQHVSTKDIKLEMLKAITEHLGIEKKGLEGSVYIEEN